MNELTTKRLAIIRHLFEKGKALSHESEPLNGLSLLPFHDSVEMFMKLCADEKSINITRDTKFAHYFDLLPDLQDKTQMISLKDAKGQVPDITQLSESFQEYKDNPQRLLINVISNIPFNILKWYKDDIYSSKLADLIFDRIHAENNHVIKHVLVSLTIYEQPERWNIEVEKYLADLDRNSFYFADTIHALEAMYANGVMSEQNIAKTRNLILLAYTKLVSKDNRLKPGDVKWISKDSLPDRRMDEES